MQPALMTHRRAGVLLHITSLPGPHSHGDIGGYAYKFVDQLYEAGFSVWQILPLNPTHGDLSPYQSLSAHAGNPHLINLEWLVEKGWLNTEDLYGKDVIDDHCRMCCIKQAYEEYNIW